MSNPLKDVDPTSIDELLSRDPLSLTEDDVRQNVRQLVLMLRAERAAWETEKVSKKASGKRMAGGTTKKLQKQAALEAIRKAPAKLDLSAMMQSKA